MFTATCSIPIRFSKALRMMRSSPAQQRLLTRMRVTCMVWGTAERGLQASHFSAMGTSGDSSMAHEVSRIEQAWGDFSRADRADLAIQVLDLHRWLVAQNKSWERLRIVLDCLHQAQQNCDSLTKLSTRKLPQDRILVAPSHIVLPVTYRYISYVLLQYEYA
jgi:hypothetical protein